MEAQDWQGGAYDGLWGKGWVYFRRVGRAVLSFSFLPLVHILYNTLLRLYLII